MTWGDALQEVNYWAPLAGTIASGLLGFLWYGPTGFQNNWMKLVGLKKKDLDNRDGMTVLFLTMYVVYFLAAVMLATVLVMSGLSGGGDGAVTGAIIGLTAGMGPLMSTYGFARRKFDLALIDGGYILVTFTVMGAIVGMWN